MWKRDGDMFFFFLCGTSRLKLHCSTEHLQWEVVVEGGLKREGETRGQCRIGETELDARVFFCFCLVINCFRMCMREMDMMKKKWNVSKILVV